MKQGQHSYEYKGVVNGQGYYALVRLEVSQGSEGKKVINLAPKSVPEEMLNSTIEGCNCVLNHAPQNLEVRIHQLQGIPVDSLPIEFGIASIIGLIDLLELPTGSNHQKVIDDFIKINRPHNTNPNFQKLVQNLL